MAVQINDKFVKDMQAPERGYRIEYDDKLTGFGVRITAGGTRSFILRYWYNDPNSEHRKASEYRYTIGEYGSEWSVAAARRVAEEWRRKMGKGLGHPMEGRHGRRKAVKAKREGETFKEAVEDYVARVQEGERGNATAGEVKRALLKACEDWKGRALVSIEPKDIRALLEALRDGNKDEREEPRPYLANRIYAYLKTFFAWCAEPGIDKVKASPMLGLRRPWAGEETRDRVFTDAEIKKLWKAADEISSTAGAYLKVLMLTGKRKGALAAMKWAEIDDDGVWSPPVDPRRRKKNKRLHGIPLPALARRIIAPLKPAADAENPSEYVFPGRHKGSCLYPGSDLAADIKDKSGITDFYFHALRHTCETRLAELGVAPHIRDMLMDHAPARGAGAGYDHHHYGKEMRAALDLWAEHIGKLVAPQGVAVLR